ncbi:MAG: fasciclin domain-containing protein, partial [Flavobacteriales bacterium]|nr:fasciclin domain-containing protein [Flavobacteriales bacterium]
MKIFIQMNYLKKITMAIMFLAIPLFIVSCSDDDDNNKVSDSNIVQIAQATPDLSTLVDALVEANLTEALSGPGPFTVFAPSNAAFAKLDPDILNNIISTPSLLTALLTYHVASAELTSDVLNGSVQTLLSGQSLSVVNSGGVTINGTANVTTADVLASNGVIHVIDEVLIPEDFYAQTL